MNVEDDLTEKLQELLKDLEGQVAEIEASSIVSAEGLPIASALPVNVDETRVAAITAVMLNMSERACMDFEKGNLNQIIIRGSKGFLISMAVGENAVLTVSATHDARLGIILYYMENTVKKIEELLSVN